MGLVLGVALLGLGIVVFYELVRAAVRHGVRDALKDHERWKRGQG